jgi:hypothetical protein
MTAPFASPSSLYPCIFAMFVPFLGLAMGVLELHGVDGGVVGHNPGGMSPPSP